MGKKFTSEYQPNNKGKPKGAVTRTTCIRKAIFNIFNNPENESLEDFMQTLKTKEPVEFIKVMARLVPKELNVDGNLNITNIRRIIIDEES